MIGIEKVASHLPSGRVDNIAQAASLGFEESFIRDKVGFTGLRKMQDGDSTASLGLAAVAALGLSQFDDIDFLIVCTQNPDGHGLPNMSSALHAALKLPAACACFDVSLGCSGYVYSIGIAKAFMEANGLKRGLVVTSDPYSRIIAPNDRNTAILFGDGATATLMSETPVWKIGASKFGTNGALAGNIAVQDNGELYMNGRQVFAFTAKVVPGLVADTLKANKLELEDVDLFLMHQGSRYIVDELRRRLNIDADHMPFMAGETGNLVSSSIPTMLSDPLLESKSSVLIAGFGVGLSWAATHLSRV
jgi:3-oxoacyl-[acyl-carrier-protein] synthase-3